MGFISSSFHFVLMVHFIYVVYYDHHCVEPDETRKKHDKIGFGNLKYLTYWNLLFQCLYYIIAFANDLPRTFTRFSEHQSDLQKWRDFLFTSIGFSAATFVCVAFWGLYAVDRELIFPVEWDDWYPNWLNHGHHSIPIIGVFIEVWLVHHKFPNRLTGIITVGMFTMLYCLWICFIAYYWDSFWVYPILGVLSMFWRTIFLSICSLVMCSFYFLGEYLHNLAWRSRKAKYKSH